MEKFFARLHLGKLYGAEYEEREVDGVMEEGIWIPMRPNGIMKSRSYGASLPITILEKKYRGTGKYYHQSHLAAVDYRKDKEQLKRMQELGYANPLFIIGYAYKDGAYYFHKFDDKKTSIEDAMDKE